jgi:hypothetical protein
MAIDIAGGADMGGGVKLFAALFVEPLSESD